MKHAKEPLRSPWRVFAVAVVAVALVFGAIFVATRNSSSSPGSTDNASVDSPATAQKVTTTTEPPYNGWVNPKSSGEPWNTKAVGLLTFRGNPTRSYYGQGPIPTNPHVLWSYPKNGGMCGVSTDGATTSTWCGDGWTGQPTVVEQNGKTIVSFGGYDWSMHWVDAATGDNVIQPYKTGDLVKGSMSTDPDGYPLSYKGSRDNYFRIMATDRGDQAVELWKLSAYDGVQQVWNDDWDGAGLVIDDYLFEGGENSWFYIIKLNRGYDAAGKVTVDPQVVFKTPGWDQELWNTISDHQFSIENSVAISGNTVYFSNSSGLVQGWDITGLKEGKEPTRVFRFWTGDDTDATITIDKQGMLYVGSEWERHNDRSKEVGQMMKLDPSKPDNPLVWSLKDQIAGSGKSGVWATPAIYNGVVYFATNGGRVLGVDEMTGAVLWEKSLGSQTWQSPVVVDNTLIEGDCEGNLNAYDVSNPKVDPPLKWTVKLSGCIEATPAVWKGRIYVAARGGQLYAIGDS
jgi:hypothetical protein